MKSIFHPDSPVIRFLATLCNLIFLNLLWLFTSLPIITMGAANTALNAILFQYLDQGSDAVFVPYFKAFASNFKKSTLVWIPMLLIGGILTLDALYITGNDVSGILWIPFFLLLAALLASGTYIFGILARFDTSLRDALRNSILLFFLNPLSSISMILVQAIPVLCFFIFPSIFLRGGILWLLLGVSLFAYINAATTLRIFKKYLPKELDKTNVNCDDT